MSAPESADTGRTIRWVTVRTDEGWHLRLVARNGEIVLSSEVYTDRRAVTRAIVLASTAHDYALREVDLRTKQPPL